MEFLDSIGVDWTIELSSEERKCAEKRRYRPVYCVRARPREKESAGLLVSVQNGNIRGIIRQPPSCLTQKQALYTRGQLLKGPHGIQLLGGLK